MAIKTLFISNKNHVFNIAILEIKKAALKKGGFCIKLVC